MKPNKLQNNKKFKAKCIAKGIFLLFVNVAHKSHLILWPHTDSMQLINWWKRKQPCRKTISISGFGLNSDPNIHLIFGSKMCKVKNPKFWVPNHTIFYFYFLDCGLLIKLNFSGRTLSFNRNAIGKNGGNSSSNRHPRKNN